MIDLLSSHQRYRLWLQLHSAFPPSRGHSPQSMVTRWTVKLRVRVGAERDWFRFEVMTVFCYRQTIDQLVQCECDRFSWLQQAVRKVAPRVTSLLTADRATPSVRGGQRTPFLIADCSNWLLDRRIDYSLLRSSKLLQQQLLLTEQSRVLKCPAFFL